MALAQPWLIWKDPPIEEWTEELFGQQLVVHSCFLLPRFHSRRQVTDKHRTGTLEYNNEFAGLESFAVVGVGGGPCIALEFGEAEKTPSRVWTAFCFCVTLCFVWLFAEY